MSVEEKIRELLEATAPGKSGVKAEPMPKIAKNKAIWKTQVQQ